MEQKLDKIMAAAGKAANATIKATSDLVGKGKEKAEQMVLERKLARAQKQLGSLVYALHKQGESNEGLMDYYIEQIDQIKAEMAHVKTQETEMDVHACTQCGNAEVQEGAMFCSRCGAQLP